MNWKNQKILVTGGASFIGSHLVDALVRKGAQVRIVDNLSVGKRVNISTHLKTKKVEFILGDLLDSRVAQKVTKKMDIVFHLACDHGGRGYVDLHQAACSTNFTLDGNVFLASIKAGVDKIIYASSGCVYPNYLQTDPKKNVYLTEDLVKPPYDADNMYGWSKLMGELTLKAYHHDWGIKAVSCRYFTVYGERAKEDHAIMAMIAKAFVRQDPFIVWGNGKQIRNWTYVTDIVQGTLLAAEKIDDGSAINLGNTERIKVIDAAKQVLKIANFDPKIKTSPQMPTGPVNRVADTKLAKKLLGWQAKVKFKNGVKKTMDWYFSTKDRKVVEEIVQHKLTERLLES